MRILLWIGGLLAMLAATFLFLSPAAGAHGDRPSFEKQIGDILVDIGYTTDHISPGTEVQFDFDIFNTSEELAFEPFSTVDISFLLDGISVHSQILQSDTTNVPFLRFTFKKSGNYTLNVVFNRPAKEAVKASFPFTVGDEPGSGSTVGDEHAESTAFGTFHYVLGTILFAFAAIVLVMGLKSRFTR